MAQTENLKPLTVVYIITKLELGGAQKVCLTLLNGVQSDEISTKLISGSDGMLASTLSNKDQCILLDSFKREVSGTSIFNELKCFIQLIRELKKLKKENPNLIVHTHSTKAGILGRWAAFFAGIKLRIHTIHGFAFHDHQSRITWWGIYLAELITSIITTHFVCVSSADVITGMRLFPGFAKKHSIIRAAVDEKFYGTAAMPVKNPNKHFTFGTIACFKPQKNLFDLLKAFHAAHQNNPDIRLEIIGDGEQRKDIETWIQDNNLESLVVLHGWHDDVLPIMQSWDAFALTSFWEGLPCAIIEARLLKLPVLCYDTGGISDVIENEKNGMLYKKGDWLSLAQDMIELSRNSALYTQLSLYSEKLDNFKSSEMISLHTALYRANISHQN